ncbi:Uncharacterised protein [Mycobacteroides abscessus subsp. abscessus]|nr:Uncharacterised protein [Mycobacteroides abscessus subsp. abscessus]
MPRMKRPGCACWIRCHDCAACCAGADQMLTIAVTIRIRSVADSNGSIHGKSAGGEPPSQAVSKPRLSTVRSRSASTVA